MKKFIKSLLGSGTQTLSSKRFTGLVCVLSLIIAFFVSLFSSGKFSVEGTLVDTIALLAFGSLGLTSTEAIFGKKYDNKKDDESQSAD